MKSHAFCLMMQGLFCRSTPSILIVALLVLAFGALAGPALAGQDADERTREQVLQSMKERFPQLLEAMRRGELGEGNRGLVGIPTAAGQIPDQARQLMAGENRDRTRFYVILAAELEITPDQVAARNRARLYDRAEKGFWLQRADGSWQQKQ
jgi:uncharacterized protein YdbL (DUF1318 family)